MGLVAIAAGCGGDDDAGGTMTTTGGTSQTRLVVREYDGDRLVRVHRPDCAVADGPCARVAELLPRLPPDPDEICTEIYGGPERMVVEGRHEGAPVRVEVTRTNGCQIARYDLLRAALEEG